MLDATAVQNTALNAARYCATYVNWHPDTPLDSSLTAQTELTIHDWGIITPLFIAYIAREEAKLLEASRIMGVDVFGRSVSEIEAEIRTLEDDLSRRLFMEDCFSL
jgi:hypothetical protein